MVKFRTDYVHNRKHKVFYPVRNEDVEVVGLSILQIYIQKSVRYVARVFGVPDTSDVYILEAGKSILPIIGRRLQFG